MQILTFAMSSAILILTVYFCGPEAKASHLATVSTIFLASACQLVPLLYFMRVGRNEIKTGPLL